MSGTHTSRTDRLSKIRLYRRLMIVAVVVGTLGFVAVESAGYPVVGVAIYWAGILAFVGIWRGTSPTLFDERDCALERRASLATLQVSAVAMIAVAPALKVVTETTSYTVPPAFDGALYAVAAQGAVFGVAYLWLRYRP